MSVELNINMPLENHCPVAAADVVCDLCGVGCVVHQQKVHFSDVFDEELFVTAGKKVACLGEG